MSLLLPISTFLSLAPQDKWSFNHLFFLSLNLLKTHNFSSSEIPNHRLLSFPLSKSWLRSLLSTVGSCSLGLSPQAAFAAFSRFILPHKFHAHESGGLPCEWDALAWYPGSPRSEQSLLSRHSSNSPDEIKTENMYLPVCDIGVLQYASGLSTREHRRFLMSPKGILGRLGEAKLESLLIRRKDHLAALEGCQGWWQEGNSSLYLSNSCISNSGASGIRLCKRKWCIESRKQRKKYYALLISLLKGFLFFVFFFFLELRTEPRALRLLGKCSTTELNPQPRSRSFIVIPKGPHAFMVM